MPYVGIGRGIDLETIWCSMAERNRQSPAGNGTALGWFVLASVLVHVVGGLGVASVPQLWKVSESESSDQQEPKSMSVTLSEPQALPETQKPRTPKRTQRPNEKKRRAERDEPKKQQKKPNPVERRNRKTVDQSTNEKTPEEADYLSSEANQTDEQTQARETTRAREASRAEQSPETASQAQAKGGENPAALASRQAPSGRRGAEKRPQEQSEPSPAPEPSTPSESESSHKKERSPESPVDEPTDEQAGADVRASERSEEASSDGSETPEQREAPPMPTMRDYEQLFGGESDRQTDRPDEQTEGQGGPGHAMFKNIEERRGRVKAALENYLTHIKPGNHTSVNARRSVYASYINRIHRKVHARWGSGYLPRLDARYGPGHPLSNSDLHTVLEIVVDAQSAEVADVNIVQSSGVTSYDAEAVMIAYDTGPHPNPPEEIVSPDGRVYLHWNFWRDQRQCGTFGVSVYKRLEDGGGKKEMSPTGG